MATHLPTSSLPSTRLSKIALPFTKSWNRAQFTFPKSSIGPLRCAVSVLSEPIQSEKTNNGKPYPAEVSRTIMELSSVGTLSAPTQDGWPLGIGVRFAVDPHGTPVLFLNDATSKLSVNCKSTIHVQLEQYGLRTPQCTVQGTLEKPEDTTALKKLHSVWKKRFGHEVDEDHLFLLSVERVLQLEDFAEDGIWVTSSDYKLANPDPLRDFAGRMIEEINTHNREDILRFCSIYVDLDFQVSDAKMLWVDRLGFDVRFRSPQNDVFEARIPFPREVTDEKGAKSSFNCMSQLAWEVEKNFHAAEFEKAKQLKKIQYTGL
ncbi:PREDICTED: glutamyl-tRNA reductase-binding protein, chloroplastic isoform X1 [Nicotiana attenuata]|uniref:Glutamyl-trna reductase-binding protein, chloroplastic n=1 Tax=Nicotiana attenuata TaxID=49451 RepID=A0A1J6J669_NICAT|nr:PREDICTED: glutamyl-tRNA reductase-binding protein, chloroplastic isoform X1 [Nicotiana attenuata]OIT06395.1 glutamyl-trna reductase-binding protein, chloroplastic [Nicotiana attenuata]